MVTLLLLTEEGFLKTTALKSMQLPKMFSSLQLQSLLPNARELINHVKGTVKEQVDSLGSAVSPSAHGFPIDVYSSGAAQGSHQMWSAGFPTRGSGDTESPFIPLHRAWATPTPPGRSPGSSEPHLVAIRIMWTQILFETASSFFH